MNNRTYGETKNCAGCRYWSEMIAKWEGGPHVEAYCLAPDGPYSNEYTTSVMHCDAWKSGHLGAVDQPPDYGAATQKAYELEDAK